ncbi:MAG TPA: hypothetical protein VFU63_13410 [Ktedonobacterales bacterium]|nr:hypothetical protein [Ktedonobacterales bacterium]
MARHPSPPAERAAQRERDLGRTLLALRLGASTFAVLVGVACYVLLDEFTMIGTVPAFVVGLVFALLTRTAAASLARDWLVRSAQRAANEREDRHDSTTPPARR